MDLIMKKRNLALSKVYGLLEPGPVVLLSSTHKGKNNIMTLSWHTMIDFLPPIWGCVISNRDYSYHMIKSSKECVINIPTVELAKQVVACGNSSGEKIDKFAKYGFTPALSRMVKAPLIAECYANLECKITNTKLVSEYGLFIFEVVNAWIAPSVKAPKTLHHEGNGIFRVAEKRIKLPSAKK